jgi:glycosyltransferase involved in cell wall biosynthesis
MKLVIHNSARVWGGNEKWFATLAEGLIARGHPVVVSCRPDGDVPAHLRERGIPASHVRPGTYGHLPRALRFARWLRHERPDALLLTSWREVFWGAWAARRAGVPRVVVRLGIVRAPDRRRHALPFRRWVDAMIVNAPEIRREWLRAAPWFPADEVHVVLNGIRPRPVDRAAAGGRLRSEIGAAPGTLLIGGAGHVTTRKGFDLLLDAFARAELEDARVVVAGSGPQLAELGERAERLGIADRVTWLGHRDDVPEVLAGCDVFALTSRNEGMANVMLEAMAAGTPAVATDISGVRAALGAEDGRPPAGWIVPVDDADALARALADVAGLIRRDPAAVRARVDEAHWRVANRFSVDRMVEHAASVLAGTAGPARDA